MTSRDFILCPLVYWEIAMGFFNNVSNSFNRGVSTVSRSGKTAQLNMQLNELMKQRQGLAAQLGASLYDATKNDPRFTAGREGLYGGIASIDAQRANIEAQIGQLRADQAAQTAASQTYRCPSCGSTVAATDLFCSGCGLPIAQVIAGQPRYMNPASAQQQSYSPVPFQQQPVYGAASSFSPSTPAATGRVCPNCGAPMGEDDLFCMNCGTRVPVKDSEAPAVPDAAPSVPAFDAAPQVAASAEPVTSAEIPPKPTPESGSNSGSDASAGEEPSEAPAEGATGDAVVTTDAGSDTPAATSAPTANRADDAKALTDALASLDNVTIPASDAFESDVTRVMDRTPRSVSSPSGRGVSQPQFAPSAAPMPVPTAAPVVAPTAAPAPAVRRCPNCGAEVGPTEKFCFSCGSKLN